MELRADNPCDRILPDLIPQHDIVQYMRALPPSRRGAAVETVRATTLPKMLQHHGIPAVAHGFRSRFRDWAAAKTDHPREVIEAALAHVVENKVEAASARSDLFEHRRHLMNDWAVYFNAERGQVIPRRR